MERHRVGSPDPPQRRDARRRTTGRLGRLAQSDLRHDYSRIVNGERRLLQFQLVPRAVLYAQYDLGPRQPLPPGLLDRFEPDVSLRLLGHPAAGAQRQYDPQQQYAEQHAPQSPAAARNATRSPGPATKRTPRRAPARRSGTGTGLTRRSVLFRRANPAAEAVIRGRTARSYAFCVHRHFCPV